VMAEPPFEAVYRGNPAVHAILPPSGRAAFMCRPHLTLNLHGGTRSIKITAASFARHRAGFAHFRAPLLYNLRIPRAQEILHVDRKVHTAEHLASAMFFLGVPAGEIPRAKLVPSGPSPVPLEPRPAAIHAVAAAPEKTWPADHFLAIAGHLAESGLSPVFVGGPDDDLAPFRAHRTLQASLSDLKNLLASASLFVGNDSGPAHMAAAFGLPSVVLFGASDPEIWGPWRTSGEAVTAPGGIGGARAIGDISVAQVIGALQRLRVAA